MVKVLRVIGQFRKFKLTTLIFMKVFAVIKSFYPEKLRLKDRESVLICYWSEMENNWP